MFSLPPVMLAPVTTRTFSGYSWRRAITRSCMASCNLTATSVSPTLRNGNSTKKAGPSSGSEQC